MRRLTRILSGGALALTLTACAVDFGHEPGPSPGTLTAFLTLGPFTAPPPPSPPAAPPPSGTPTEGPSPSVSGSPGSGPSVQPGRGDLRPTQLGPDGHADRMYASLATAGLDDDDLEEAHKALTVRPPKGEVGLAFVLSGCRETKAHLKVEGRTVSASLTGGENWNCDQPENYLATFTVLTEDLPDGWTFRHGRR